MTLRRISCILLILALFLTVPAFAEDEGIIFDVTDYISSIASLDLTPHKGKIIALVFYNSDEESTAQLPAWQLIHQDFDPDEVAIFLVHASDGEGQAESDQLKEQYALENMTIYEDEDRVLCTTLGVTQFPNTLFLDPQGTPVSGYSGRLNYETIASCFTTLGATQLQNSYLADN